MPQGIRMSSGYGGMTLWAVGLPLAMAARILLLAFGGQGVLERRVEVATPLNSLLRLAEGHWLKQLGMSPYAGSAYHGSPLLLAVLGPVIDKSVGIFIMVDIVAALLLHAISRRQHLAHVYHMASLGLSPSRLGHDDEMKRQEKESNGRGLHVMRDVVGLLYLVNPLTVVTCIGGSTSPIENLMCILALHGAVIGNIPLAAFAWAVSAHLSMYPGILIVPVALLLVFGLDRPQTKSFILAECNRRSKLDGGLKHKTSIKGSLTPDSLPGPRWVALRDLAIWSVIWWFCIFTLCQLALGDHSSLKEMLTKTYGFALTVPDLTPNLGIFWYFFTEVFDHFRSFFTILFHANIVVMILPLTIRIPHRPLFLAFIFLAISSLLKSYPSVGDAALYCGLLPLFAEELSEMRFTFLLFFGNLLVMTLGPVMYNLWIWRGTGNANFYFAITLVYAALQIILIIECLRNVIQYDRNVKKAVEGPTATEAGVDKKRD